jgi:hypothetical protein
MTYLTGDQQQRLHKALLDAFPSKTALAQCVKFELNEHLDVIAHGENLSEIAFKLINWAQTVGRTADLITGASRANSGNPLLKAFVEGLHISPAVAQAPRAAASTEATAVQTDQTATQLPKHSQPAKRRVPRLRLPGKRGAAVLGTALAVSAIIALVVTYAPAPPPVPFDFKGTDDSWEIRGAGVFRHNVDSITINLETLRVRKIQPSTPNHLVELHIHVMLRLSFDDPYARYRSLSGQVDFGVADLCCVRDIGDSVELNNVTLSGDVYRREYDYMGVATRTDWPDGTYGLAFELVGKKPGLGEPAPRWTVRVWPDLRVSRD